MLYQDLAYSNKRVLTSYLIMARLYVIAFVERVQNVEIV